MLTAGRLEPGHYRIVAHDWLGGPQGVDLKLTFFNQDGQPGEGTSGEGTVGTAWFVTSDAFGSVPAP